MNGIKSSAVLLVDDHPFIRMSLRTVLENDATLNVETVMEADSCEAAELLIEENVVDLIILDISLPDNDGYKLISKVRLSSNNSAAKILVFSILSDINATHKALKAGANGFVCKTESIDYLLMAVKATLSGFQCFAPKSTQRSKSGVPDDQRMTQQEFNIAMLISKGLNNKEISRKLFISEKTVSTHKMNITKKIGSRSKAKLFEFLKKVNNEIL